MPVKNHWLHKMLYHVTRATRGPLARGGYMGYLLTNGRVGLVHYGRMSYSPGLALGVGKVLGSG